MSSLGFIVALLSLTGAANAMLKPIEADFHPFGNKAVTVYKTTPRAIRRSISIFRWIGAQPIGGCNRLLLWRQLCNRSPAQFSTTAEYFATCGLVAASAEYRITTIHRTPPERCAEEGKSAIRWLRMNARHLGIDGMRVIARRGARRAGNGVYCDTRSNWCSDLSSLATAPLRSQWFGTRNNRGHRPWW